MKETETLRQLAAATNDKQLVEVGRTIETLRQAHISNAEQLAALLEPLAQAMAALTDETRESLTQIGTTSQAQGEHFQRQIESAITAWRNAAAAAQNAAVQLDRAGRRMERSHYLLAMATGLVTGLLVSASWLWLAPARPIENLLDAKAVAEYLLPEIAALKPHKGR